MSELPEIWVNLDDIAKYLSVHRDTIRNWIAKGTIPHTRAGKQYKFRISEVDEWMKSGRGAKADQGEEE